MKTKTRKKSRETQETSNKQSARPAEESYFKEKGIYLEEDFEGEDSFEAEEMTFEEEAQTEASLEEHEDVSNSEIAAGMMDAEGEDFGSEKAPSKTETHQELEMVDGYDESFLELDREDVQMNVDENQLLDAWYAEFADPAVQAIAAQQKDLVKNVAEVVIGKDDRVKIQNTRLYPWRAICSLRITAADGSQWIGTGWLVSHRTLITAGHVVYIHSRGGWVNSIEVIPGRNGSSKPFGSKIATSFRSVKGWTNSKKRSHDYGAIILPTSFPIGKTVGYFGYANLAFTSLLGLKVNLSGYPGDKPVGTQWWHARKIKFVTGRTLIYNIDTAGGQSGSPVWRLKNGKRHAVGIHTNGSSSGNSATRITKPVFKNIKKWKYQGM